ncbi:hypothetical protein DSECCO2_648470 [anaerobic digester metagenome]
MIFHKNALIHIHFIWIDRFQAAVFITFYQAMGFVHYIGNLHLRIALVIPILHDSVLMPVKHVVYPLQPAIGVVPLLTSVEYIIGKRTLTPDLS